MADNGTIALVLVIILIFILIAVSLLFFIKSRDLNNNRSNFFIEYIHQDIVRQPTISTIYLATSNFSLDILSGVRKGNLIGIKNISGFDIEVNNIIIEPDQYIEFVIADELVRLI